jgi:hypothetical protein
VKCRRCRFASRLRLFSAMPSISNLRDLGKAIVFFAFPASSIWEAMQNRKCRPWIGGTTAIAAIRAAC